MPWPRLEPGFFYGIGESRANSWTTPIVWVPVVLGTLALTTLIVRQYVKEEPLMPVKPITSTFPVIGAVGAMIAGAAYTGLLQILIMFLVSARKLPPEAAGMLFWPGIGAALLSAGAFGFLFNTRYVLVLPPLGLLLLALAALLLATTSVGTGDYKILWIAGIWE